MALCVPWCQVHKLENGDVKIFSRNSEDMTSKYPDLIQALPAAIKDDVTSFVMDAEVGGHKEHGQIGVAGAGTNAARQL
jgi:ATP-dependent DNA ligase